MAAEEQGYNGWTNYETWVVTVWMDNDQGSYEDVREVVRDVLDEAPQAPQVDQGIWTVPEAARYELAGRLRDEYEGAMPELEGIWSDLLRAGFMAVDWLEIATNLVQEVSEESPSGTSP